MIYDTITLTPFSATLTPICISNTSELKMTPRRAIVVCPGGGYHFLSDREAEPIALQFLAAGFATFILRYSIGEGAANYTPLKEVAAAVRFVREHAADYNIDPDYVFTCGFSAGGHLAASAGVLWRSPALAEVVAGAPEGIARPTGMILSYPVITGGDFAHKGSFYRLCGTETPTDAELDAFSLEKHVDATTPPTFLWHTFTDKTVPVQNALFFADAMATAGVPLEMHIFPAGRHGLSLANEQTNKGAATGYESSAAGWVELAVRWARELEA